MKIEPGKYYRTRDGRKAFVAAEYPDVLAKNIRFAGWIGEGEGGSWVIWTADGEGRLGADIYSNGYGAFDLIEPWREPESGWVNVDAGGVWTSQHKTRQGADHHATPDRIACIPFKEGEGL